MHQEQGKVALKSVPLVDEDQEAFNLNYRVGFESIHIFSPSTFLTPTTAASVVALYFVFKSCQ